MMFKLVLLNLTIPQVIFVTFKLWWQRIQIIQNKYLKALLYNQRSACQAVNKTSWRQNHNYHVKQTQLWSLSEREFYKWSFYKGIKINDYWFSFHNYCFKNDRCESVISLAMPKSQMRGTPFWDSVCGLLKITSVFLRI